MDSSKPNEKKEGDEKGASGNSKSSPEQPKSTTNNPAAVELLEEDDEFEVSFRFYVVLTAVLVKVEKNG